MTRGEFGPATFDRGRMVDEEGSIGAAEGGV
jgi:hypothetical protein